jgi:hypothetical protein
LSERKISTTKKGNKEMTQIEKNNLMIDRMKKEYGIEYNDFSFTDKMSDIEIFNVMIERENEIKELISDETEIDKIEAVAQTTTTAQDIKNWGAKTSVAQYAAHYKYSTTTARKQLEKMVKNGQAVKGIKTGKSPVYYHSTKSMNNSKLGKI